MSPRRFRPPALYMKAPFLQRLLDGMPYSIKVIDRQHRLVYANKASRNTLQAKLNEIRGRFCYQVFYNAKSKCAHCIMKRVFNECRSDAVYFTMAINGTNRDFEKSVFPVPGTEGKVDYAVEMVKDITPLKAWAIRSYPGLSL